MKIKVNVGGELREVQANPGHTLLEYLRLGEIAVNAACGGRGTCHKCRVKVTNGFIASTSTDSIAFSAKELKDGWRLSCQSRPRTNLECSIPMIESARAAPRLVVLQKQEAHDPYVVVDLGSTGVVAALCDRAHGILAEAHALNQQVLLGADVMSRLQYIQQHGLERPRELIFKTLRSLFQTLEKHNPSALAKAKTRDVFIAGNSVMVSILHNWDCATLAVSPFRPATLQAGETDFEGYRLKSLPLMGGFVGADTMAGILFLELELKVQGPWALVDIGTNTEIVIKNAAGDYVYSSAPAGPAFEGGNILCGMLAEPGAIAKAHYKNQHWQIETIGQDVARGICGSGLFDLISEGIQADLIKKDGYIPEGRLEICEDITLIADDIREFQLAKAATKTAFEILADRAGGLPPKTYLAGTFAEHIALGSLERVSLLPADTQKIVIGNTSLKGLAQVAIASDPLKIPVLEQVRRHGRHVELALEADFQERFVQNINF